MGPLLLVDRGDLPSLTAAFLQPDPSRLLLWHVAEAGAGAASRRAVVEAHVALFGARELVVTADRPGPPGAAARHPAIRDALTLLDAVLVAREHGCAKIIWPVQVGPDAEAVCRAVDCATAVTDLADLDPLPPRRPGGPEGTGALVIDLPLVDLDDEQVVDLADDAGAPWNAFWPCDGDEEGPCGACGGCGRWARAFEERGLPVPWRRAEETRGTAPAAG